MKAILVAVASSLLVPAAASAAAVPAAPDWYEAGIDTLLDDLWLESVGALQETRLPIDHGDQWAWAGDNAKALGALSRSSRAGGVRAEAIADFATSLSSGPVVFQRWVNSDNSIVVRNTQAAFEVSNHLYTLEGQLDRATVSATVEYHDRRDKRMLEFGPPHVRLDGQWRDAANFLSGAEIRVAPGNASVQVRLAYSSVDFEFVESFLLDAQPRILHEVEFLHAGSALDGLRLVIPVMEAVQPELATAAKLYTQYMPAGQGLFTVDETTRTLFGADELSHPWAMYLDPGRQDDFANGIGVWFESPSMIGAQIVPVPGNGPNGSPAHGIGFLTHEYRWAGGSTPEPLVERVTLFDGVATQRLDAYGAIMENISLPSMAGVDPSLIYELGDTALGILEYAIVLRRDDLIERVWPWLNVYADDHGRGTQARSLAAAAYACMLLYEYLGDEHWLSQAIRMAESLYAYQRDDPADPSYGGVQSEPGSRVFVDATAGAARAWAAVARATDRPELHDRAELAWQSLITDGDRVLQRGPEPSDDNHWAFKSGLILLAAPDAPGGLRWAARNHVWAVLDDLDAFELRTSRFSGETNSETQSWVLEGLINDRESHVGPWIIDAESTVFPVASETTIRLRVGFSASYVWIEPGWQAWIAGSPAPKESGPHGSWRYRLDGDADFWPSYQHLPQDGWAVIPNDAGHELSPASMLSGHQVNVAWGLADDGATWLYWLPGNDAVSTLANVPAGHALIVRTTDGRPVETPARTDIAAGLGPGLVSTGGAPASAAEMQVLSQMWGRDAPPALLAPAARFVGTATGGGPPTLAALLYGSAADLGSTRTTRAGALHVEVDGGAPTIHAADAAGRFAAPVPVDRAATAQYWYEIDGQPLTNRVPVDLAPGVAVAVKLSLREGPSGAASFNPATAVAAGIAVGAMLWVLVYLQRRP